MMSTFTTSRDNLRFLSYYKEYMRSNAVGVLAPRGTALVLAEVLLRDYINNLIRSIENITNCKHIISGNDICINIRWCEVRTVSHPCGVANIWHIIDNPVVRSEIRQYISDELGVNIEHIGDIEIPKAEGPYNWQGTGHFRGARIGACTWDIYEIGYSYSELTPAERENSLGILADILNKITAIDSLQRSSRDYERLIVQSSTDLVELEQKALDLSGAIANLQIKTEHFKIRNIIKNLNDSQKAHLLLKVWGKDDLDSIKIIESIKQYDFDPHYSNKDGLSLLQLTLDRRDIILFDLLIKNKINFSKYINNASIAKLILDSDNNEFIEKMISIEQDFNNVALEIVLNDDVSLLTKLIVYKPDVTKIIYLGYSLLQLSLKQGSYSVAEKILQNNPVIVSHIGSNGLTAVQTALIEDNKQAIKLLEKYDVNFQSELIKAIDQGLSQVVFKILAETPDLIFKNYDEESTIKKYIEEFKPSLFAMLLEQNLVEDNIDF